MAWNNSPIIANGNVFLHHSCTYWNKEGQFSWHGDESLHTRGDLLIAHSGELPPKYGNDNRGSFRFSIFDGKRWRRVWATRYLGLESIQYDCARKRLEKAPLVRKRLTSWAGKTLVWSTRVKAYQPERKKVAVEAAKVS